MPHPLLWWIKRAVITDINLFHIIFHATWAVLHLFNLRFIWFLLQVSFHPLWNRRHIALTWRGDSGDVKVRKVCVIYGPHDRALTIAITRNLPVYIDVVGWRVSDRKSYIRWPLAPILPPPPPSPPVSSVCSSYSAVVFFLLLSIYCLVSSDSC